ALQFEELLDGGGELLVLHGELAEVSGLQRGLTCGQRILGVREGLSHRIRIDWRLRAALVRWSAAAVRRGRATVRRGRHHTLVTAGGTGITAEEHIQRLGEGVLERRSQERRVGKETS